MRFTKRDAEKDAAKAIEQINICPLCSSEPCCCSTEVWEDFTALPSAYYDPQAGDRAK